ncbi:VOC family protein [Oceanobacillus senegalensis]|nr:VOC family protein [Oceanobacillus senegalensis]
MNLRLELFVDCIKNSVEFYCDILGFKVPDEMNADFISVRKRDVV